MRVSEGSLGTQDFRRKTGRELRREPIFLESSCLYCFFNHNQHFLDSEWHGFFECPLIHVPRREFLLLTRLDGLFDTGSSVEIFALLVARVREDKKMVNALARFALQVQEYRHSWFRQLSSEAKQQCLATKLETSFNI